jgi:heptosyltransferase III
MSGSFPILVILLEDPKRALTITGVMARLSQEVPRAAFTVVTRSQSTSLFADWPQIENMIAFDGPVESLEGLKLWWRLRKRIWGLVIDTGPTSWSSFIKTKTKALAHKDTSKAHPVVMASDLLHLEDEAHPTLLLTPERMAAARILLDHDNTPLLAIAPGASWVGAQWPSERFAVLASRLLNENGPLKGGRLLILGSESDREASQSLRMAAPKARIIDLTAKIDYLTAYACLTQADMFIGNDDIWLHLASIAGIKAYGLFGPSDEQIEAPLRGANILRTTRSYAEILASDPNLDLAVCHMVDLTVDQVFKSICTGLE